MRIFLRGEDSQAVERVRERVEQLRAEYNEAISIDNWYRKKRLAEAEARGYGSGASYEVSDLTPPH